MNEHPARQRNAPLEMTGDEFRSLGHSLVDRIADFLDSIRDRALTPGAPPSVVREILGDATLPAEGTPPKQLMEEATGLLFDNSLFNSHPRYWGYIIGSPAPIGALGDFLAAAVNPNLGGWRLSPMATEIEAQTVRWIAEMIGYPTDCGGLLVSGGNMANFVGFLTGRRMKAPWNIRSDGLRAGPGELRAYVSRETHTWVQKAADLFGLGTESICWVATDAELRMDLDDLQRQIVADRAAGKVPFLVVGTGGTVGTGAVDPLPEIASLCRENDLWFHVDGAYGAVAAVLPEAPEDLRGLAEADSVALDPHKWLYSAAEAGCVLVRDQQWLKDTFSYRPEYYEFEERDAPINYFELGPQNSRNFRALKVWLGLRQAGRAGYEQMVRDDIALARAMHAAVGAHPELEARTCNLSIVTFRYVPSGLSPGDEPAEAYLNELNRVLVDRLQVGGELFVSNYVTDGAYLLRACITNFRTTLADVEALPEIVARVGGELDREMRPEELK